MRTIPMLIGLTLTAGIVTGAISVEFGNSSWNGAAIAATAKQKSQGRQSLNQVVSSLRAGMLGELREDIERELR